MHAVYYYFNNYLTIDHRFTVDGGTISKWYTYEYKLLLVSVPLRPTHYNINYNNNLL